MKLRSGFLVLAGLAVAGTAVELAMLRHWDGLLQLIPWFTLGVVTVAIVLAARGRTGLARLLALAVFAAAAFGIWEHTLANYHAGPLDFRYATRWATMSAKSRWWAAFTETVGPSPTLAPLVLAWSSLCVWFATLKN